MQLSATAQHDLLGCTFAKLQQNSGAAERLAFGIIVLKYRLSLGKYLGIGLYVHWSFALLLAFFAFRSWDEGPAAVGFVIAIVCSVFFCVTLHEYGHSLAARRFGIPTVDITLFPIGGVARLERMPRIPWQELIVAVAGPAVNVVIATLLGVVLWSTGVLDELFVDSVDTGSAIVANEVVVEDGQAVTTPAAAAEQAAADAAIEQAGEEMLPPPSWMNYLIAMFGVNIMLVLFNMIPAFPMDGGRVLRSLSSDDDELSTRNVCCVAAWIFVRCRRCYLLGHAREPARVPQYFVHLDVCCVRRHGRSKTS